MNVADAEGALSRFQTLALPTVPTGELLSAAFALAVTYECAVYDALYLALMERENCPFVTADERLFNTVSADLPNIRLLRDFTL